MRYFALSSKAPVSGRARFLAAAEEARAEFARLYDETLVSMGEEQAQIFEIHRMLLEEK